MNGWKRSGRGGRLRLVATLDAQEAAGMGVLVAADGLATDPVQVGQAADPAADQDGMHRGGSQPDLGAIWAGPTRTTR